MVRQTNTQFAVAVHALTLLAREPGRARSSPEMAISVQANPVHLRRVLTRLAATGTVASALGRTAAGSWAATRATSGWARSGEQSTPGSGYSDATPPTPTARLGAA